MSINFVQTVPAWRVTLVFREFKNPTISFRTFDYHLSNVLKRISELHFDGDMDSVTISPERPSIETNATVITSTYPINQGPSPNQCNTTTPGWQPNTLTKT